MTSTQNPNPEATTAAERNAANRAAALERALAYRAEAERRSAERAKQPPSPPRNIRREYVIGAGGRGRHVSICEAGCWHGNDAQAMKCKNG